MVFALDIGTLTGTVSSAISWLVLVVSPSHVLILQPLTFHSHSLLSMSSFLFTAIYNLYFHPLRNIPGPKLAAATPLPFIWRLVNGRFPAWKIDLHEKYGVVVRVHPDELSFIGSSAWQNIYMARPQLPKPIFGVLETPNGVPSMGTIPDAESHGRQRNIHSHAFSDRALREQEHVLQRYCDLLITRLPDQVQDGKGVEEVNVCDWYNFTTFDVLGDL